MTLRGITVNASVGLVIEECYSCHVLFAFSQDLQNDLLRERQKRSFYCPNGHIQMYIGETEEQRLKRELAEASKQLAETQSRLSTVRKEANRLAEDNMDLAKSNRGLTRSNSGLKAAKTRMLRRATNGVCTSCQRSFANVRRHMESQHPDQVVTAEQAVAS